MEVGPRDGLQNESAWVSTQDKINLINNLTDCGLKYIEITAFVNPKWIPPLADQVEVAMGIKKKPGVRYVALVPNNIGYERAISCGIDDISIVIAATESHNKKNLNGTTKEVFTRYEELSSKIKLDKKSFRAYLSCAFGCPYEGEVSIEKVLALSQRLIDLGACEIAISDTIGVASPTQTIKLLDRILKFIPKEKVALHFHDTQGLALANIFCALSMGISSFDSSLGGLGGCPYALGASGNVSSEDLINMLNKLGIAHGIDLEKMLNVSRQMQEILQRALPSKLLALKTSYK